MMELIITGIKKKVKKHQVQEPQNVQSINKSSELIPLFLRCPILVLVFKQKL
jgi:hypothetical protein